MDLFDPQALRLGHVAAIWTWIWAYMLWPSDALRRQGYEVEIYADALSTIEQKRTSGEHEGDPDYALADHTVSNAFRQLGGWTALVARLHASSEISKAGKALRTAAATLDIIRKTPEGRGSLNKAVWVIQETAPAYDLIGNRTGILTAWKSHRSVAHLGLALILCGEWKPSEDPRQLRRFLAVAQDYQRFAISHKLPGQRKTLLNETEIWTVPTDLRLPRLRSVPSLPADMLNALHTYRAPQ
jgi:hypothetical protein